MPITKSRVNKAEQQRYLRCLQELRVRGWDVEIPSEWLDQSPALDIFIHRDGSTVVFGGPHGGVFYAVSTRLVAKQPYVTVVDCHCESEWDDDIVLESFQRKERIYRLGYLQYPAKEVLNDRIENSLQFSHRGQMVGGVILFSGLKPIPERYCLGMSVPFRLTFLDQFEHELEVESKLFVMRETKRKVADGPSPGTLYETAERQQVHCGCLFE